MGTADSWNDFCGANFLKASQVKDSEDAFVVEGIEIFTDDDGGSKPRLTLGHGTDEYIFDLNVTNSNFCRNAGIETPNKLLGKKVYFKKIFVPSPKTKKEVESLRICKIE